MQQAMMATADTHFIANGTSLAFFDAGKDAFSAPDKTGEVPLAPIKFRDNFMATKG